VADRTSLLQSHRIDRPDRQLRRRSKEEIEHVERR
jgi:hypothetical protein